MNNGKNNNHNHNHNHNHGYPKAWVVTVDMGYGHQRAAFPLKSLAYGGKIINASNYAGMPRADRKTWRESKKFYEFMSRFKRVPLFGEAAFDIYNKLQAIPSFYPKRDLSKPSAQIKETMALIKKREWGKHLIHTLNKKKIPLITTFFIPAFMAEAWEYGGDIYCVICDADISRAWAPPDPTQSKIKYFAPNYRVVERLKCYGVRAENIFLTGFPLPKENTGGRYLGNLRHDLGIRLTHLDPKKLYTSKYALTIDEHLGTNWPPPKTKGPPTLMFAVGGAGAQREMGVEIVKNLAQKIKEKKIKIILVAGIRNEVNQYFKRSIRGCGLGSHLGKNIKIIFGENTEDYFKKFNRALRQVDVLWTKPSELSFYTALGLPIIISTPIGSQEDFNRKWLTTIGSGIDPEDIDYVDEWFFDWIDSGWFARAAMQGFMEGGKYGTYNIEKFIKHKLAEVKAVKMTLQY
ncbi:hypothetical protein KKD80_01525 [Patescibacteria group bacterium]|nr:hypothetical protein [Patescibacteria group bacterium]